MNTLYYAPGACSIGIHILLEEIGQPFDAKQLDLKNGAQFKPDFAGINPKSKVPTLVRDDGSVLTEYPAIAFWLAATALISLVIGLVYRYAPRPSHLRRSTSILLARGYGPSRGSKPDAAKEVRRSMLNPCLLYTSPSPRDS